MSHCGCTRLGEGWLVRGVCLEIWAAVPCAPPTPPVTPAHRAGRPAPPQHGRSPNFGAAAGEPGESGHPCTVTSGIVAVQMSVFLCVWSFALAFMFSSILGHLSDFNF